jgi:dTDP-4-dehydrorhamnose reductase
LRVSLLGAGGQLGTDLRSALAHHEVIPFGHSDFDVRDAEKTRTTLTAVRPAAIVNTTAFHDLAACEADPEAAFAVNATAPAHLAGLARELGARFVHVSTDYVYGGEDRTRPLGEDVAPAPVQVHGVTKVAGERLIQLANSDALIVRSSGLYGVAGPSGKGTNFIERVLRLAREKGEMRIVSDQILSPTYTADLAEGIVTLLERRVSGIVHLTNSGSCSWYELACHVVRTAGLPAAVHPVSTLEFGAPVRRPRYSVLDNARWRSLGLAPLRPWQEALSAYLAAARVAPGSAVRSGALA